ncbi:MAG: MotA/TolQ/ExbB proton channel family protein [Clostridiales bacterium]|nr:MotA/TolQ/ExbB proton channel family protein [Clostridiales bacterium]
MDIMTIVGILIGVVLIVFSIVFGIDPTTGITIDFLKIGNFIDIPSILIVVGGVLATIFASYPMSTIKKIPKHLKIIISGNQYEPMTYIQTLVEFSQIARKNGLLALEEKANEQTDPFFKQSIMLIVDATDPEKVKAMLENDLDKIAARHEDAVGIYEKASSMAPAYGMIGTLVGLINMLKNMNMTDGGANIGQDMGTALITTFYGCILANLIFNSIANKLRIRSDEEYLCKEIIIEGVLSIQSGETPKFMEEKLISFLEQSERNTPTDSEGEEGKKKGKRKKK